MAKWNASKAQAEQGLTLIGVVVAVIVFSIALLSTTQLMARTEKNVGISREQFIATNLAREGLELVEYSRDNNWLSHNPTGDWTNRLVPLCLDDTTRTFTMEPDTTSPIGIQMRDGSDLATALYENNGHYTHTPVGDAPPVFSRQITVDCSKRAAPTGKIEVTSRVSWNSREQDREVTITTRLYNWRQ